MNMKHIKNKLTLLLCVLSATSMLLVAGGCGSNNDNAGTGAADSAITTEAGTENVTVSDAVAATEADSETERTVLGEGATVFDVMVVDQDGNEAAFEIHTDKETVGEALLEVELIAGEEGEYGLYVKTVNGITADYDTDGTYWAFYINDEYASTGVDATPVTEGDTYSFKVEK